MMGGKIKLPKLQPFVPVGPSPERAALCERLGIEAARDENGLSFLGVWAEIGMRLAAEQPEFNGKIRRRGRPSTKETGGIDYQRYNFLRNLYREAGEVLGETVTHRAAIERAINEGTPLFSRETDLLIASVSRGHSRFKEAVRETQLLRAKRFRTKCERFRRRAERLKAAEPAVARLQELHRMSPTMGLLNPLLHEMLELKARLRNSFGVTI